MSNDVPRDRVPCYTQGCKDMDPHNSPACVHCWKHLSMDERHIIKKAFNQDCENGKYVASINKVCRIYGCWQWVQLKEGAAADGRCRKCRGNGVMGTVVDTGDEKEEEAEQAAPATVVIRDSPARLPLVFATGVEKEMEKKEAARLNSAPDIVGCPRHRSSRCRSPRMPRSSRSRSPRLAALLHKCENNLVHQTRELEQFMRDVNNLQVYVLNNP